jgi:hypothetical protein
LGALTPFKILETIWLPFAKKNNFLSELELRKKMAFLKKFLTFLAKKSHFFRKFWEPLGIITNLQ